MAWNLDKTMKKNIAIGATGITSLTAALSLLSPNPLLGFLNGINPMLYGIIGIAGAVSVYWLIEGEV